jgi:putative transposase
MRKSKFSENQIVAILNEGEAGMPVAEVCRKHGISAATWYAWKSKYARVTVSELARIRELKVENAKLKRLYADLGLENVAVKDALSAESGDAVCEAAGCAAHDRGASHTDQVGLPCCRLVAGGVLPSAERWALVTGMAR